MGDNQRVRMAGASMVALVVGAVLWGIARPAQAPLDGRAPALAEADSCPYADGRRPLEGQGEPADTFHRAKHKHVLGLTLGKANRAALDVWAATHGMTCLSHRASIEVECTASAPAEVADHFVDAEAVTVLAAFGPTDRLQRLRFEANFPDANRAASALRAVWRETEVHSGAPSHVAGEPEGHFLAANVWQQAHAEFRKENLFSKVSAVNVGSHVAWVHQVEDCETEEG